MAAKVASKSALQSNENKDADNSTESGKIATVSQSSLTSAGGRVDATGDSVVYNVEHLATFSTSSGSNISKRENELHTSKENDDNKENNALSRSDLQAASDNQNSAQTDISEPRVALQRLFELEKLSGIWTQRMQIELKSDLMLIVDCETDSVVEKFERSVIIKPEAFNQYNDIYNNILVFTIKQSNITESSDINESNVKNDTPSDELHIFQCVSHDAQKLVSDILAWQNCTTSKNELMSKPLDGPKVSIPNGNQTSSLSLIPKLDQTSSPEQQDTSASAELNKSKKVDPMKTKKSNEAEAPPAPDTSSQSTKPVVMVASSASKNETVPIANVNVKETVQVFNQIAALREKGSKPTSPTNHANRPLSEASTTGSNQAAQMDTSPANEQVSAGNGRSLNKQRSIRATLAVKSTQSTDRSVPTSSDMILDQAQANSSNSSSSMGSSTDSATNAKQSQQHYPSPMHHNQSSIPGGSAQLLGNSHHDDTERSAKKQQVPVNSSSHQTNPSSQEQHISSQYKSSKSRSHEQVRSHSGSSHSHGSSGSSASTGQVDQVASNESYVSVLNHCFDDIEKFIIRIQHSVTAARELQARKKLLKKSSSQMLNMAEVGKSPMTASELAMLSARARGPNEEDYFEILSKFKLAFNLLAKLKGCIHEPNAPELVHFLFTPLAIIIDSARNVKPPVDPTIVGIPYLNQEALDLLSNCCTSKESDMWLSLGPNWTQTIDPNILKASRLPTSFQPIFSDGWAPIINELELIGLVNVASGKPLSDRALAPMTTNEHRDHHQERAHRHQPPVAGGVGAGYLLDEPVDIGGYQIESSAYPTGLSSGLSNGSKSHASRGYKKRTTPSPPLMNGRPIADAYFNHIPSDSVLEAQGPEYQLKGNKSHYRSAGHMVTNRTDRHSMNDGQPTRRMKQNPRRPDSYAMGMSQEQIQFPACPPRPNEDDLDFLPHHGGVLVHSDGYTELQERPRMEDITRLRDMPGPSSNRSRSHKSQSRPMYMQPYDVWPPNQHDIYDPNAYPVDADNLSDLDREAMLIDLGPAQMEWFFELQSRAAPVVRVLFSRDANNDKELSVRRGEILEILDDSRKWWRARNINLQVAYVPHTIVAPMQGYQTIDELLTNNPVSLVSDEQSLMQSQRLHRRDLHQANYNQNQLYDDRRNSKTSSGAFRYF